MYQARDNYVAIHAFLREPPRPNSPGKNHNDYLQFISKRGLNRVLGGAPAGRTTQNPEIHHF